MEKVLLNVGDTAWAHGLDEDRTKNRLRPAEIVHVFELWDMRHYVIEIPTSMDPVLKVRNELEVSDSPDRKIGLWRGL